MRHHIEGGYNAVPYHNSVHAADVLATFHYFVMNGGFMDWMSPLELLAGLFAAGAYTRSLLSST